MRDEHGRFVSGNPGGPGRPNRRTEHAYLEKLTGKLTMAKWSKIVSKAIEDAIEGDRYARQWLSDYAIGKPALVIDLQASDQALLAQLLEATTAQGIQASDLFNAMLVELEAADHADD